MCSIELSVCIYYLYVIHYHRIRFTFSIKKLIFILNRTDEFICNLLTIDSCILIFNILSCFVQELKIRLVEEFLHCRPRGLTIIYEMESAYLFGDIARICNYIMVRFIKRFQERYHSVSIFNLS